MLRVDKVSLEYSLCDHTGVCNGMFDNSDRLLQPGSRLSTGVDINRIHSDSCVPLTRHVVVKENRHEESGTGFDSMRGCARREG